MNETMHTQHRKGIEENPDKLHITTKMDGLPEGGYDPFPLKREDGAVINPLQDTPWQHKDNLKVEDLMMVNIVNMFYDNSQNDNMPQ